MKDPSILSLLNRSKKLELSTKICKIKFRFLHNKNQIYKVLCMVLKARLNRMPKRKLASMVKRASYSNISRILISKFRNLNAISVMDTPIKNVCFARVLVSYRFKKLLKSFCNMRN